MFDSVIEDVAPADVPDELAALRRRIDRLEAQAARLLSRMDESDGHIGLGYSSPTAFLKHRSGMLGSRAQQCVTRARALRKMPLVAELFNSGEISADKVDALVRAMHNAPEAFADEERWLLDMALAEPFVADVRRLVQHWLQRVARQDIEADKLGNRRMRGVRITKDQEFGHVSAWLTAEECETIRNALEPGPPTAADTRSVGERRADRLVDLAGSALDRPELIIHVSQDAIHGPGRLPDAETGAGVVLTPDTFDRYACDSKICRIVFDELGEPIDAGRAHRTVPPKLRKAIIARDRRCRFPTCDRPAEWCDVHHLIHWADHGRSDGDNCVLLCRFHHMLVHEGGWRMEGPSHRLRVFDPAGQSYPARPPTRPPPKHDPSRRRKRGRVLDIEEIRSMSVRKLMNRTSVGLADAGAG